MDMTHLPDPGRWDNSVEPVDSSVLSGFGSPFSSDPTELASTDGFDDFDDDDFDDDFDDEFEEDWEDDFDDDFDADVADDDS